MNQENLNPENVRNRAAALGQARHDSLVILRLKQEEEKLKES